MDERTRIIKEKIAPNIGEIIGGFKDPFTPDVIEQTEIIRREHRRCL